MFNSNKKSTWSLSELLITTWLNEHDGKAVRVISTSKDKNPDEFIDHGVNRDYPWTKLMEAPVDLQWLREEYEGQTILGCGFVCGNRYYEVWEAAYACDHWGNFGIYECISLLKGFRILAFYDELDTTHDYQLTTTFTESVIDLLPTEDERLRFLEWLAVNRRDIIGKVEEFDTINKAWRYCYFTTPVDETDDLWVQLAKDYNLGVKKQLDSLMKSWNASSS